MKGFRILFAVGLLCLALGVVPASAQWASYPVGPIDSPMWYGMNMSIVGQMANNFSYAQGGAGWRAVERGRAERTWASGPWGSPTVSKYYGYYSW